MPGGDQTLSDAVLLRRTADGDREAFEQFVARHEHAVARYLHLLTSPDAADDALQTTFISAWRAAAQFRSDGSARGWLVQIARHAVHRQFRRRVSEPLAPLSLDELAVEAGWGDQTREVEAFEVRDGVAEALKRLTPDEREVLVLRDMEGYSGEETAEMLGLTLSAQKSRLHRARLRFMAVWKEMMSRGA